MKHTIHFYRSIFVSALLIIISISCFLPNIAYANDLSDIYIDSIEIAPYQAAELADGKRAIIKCTVKSDKAIKGEFFVAFYQGSKLIKNVRVKPNQFKSNVKILEAGFKYNKSITSHSCIADSRNTIQESDETNNRLEKDTSSQPGGSIIITGTVVVTTTITTVQVGQTIDIKATGLYAPVNQDGTLKGYIYCFYSYSAPEPKAAWHALIYYQQDNSFSFKISALQNSSNGFIKFELANGMNNLTDLDKSAKCILDSTKVVDESDENNNEITFDKNSNKVPSNNHNIIIDDWPMDQKKQFDVKATKLDFTEIGGLSLIRLGIPPGNFKCDWEWGGELVDTEWKLQIVVGDDVIGEKTIKSAETAQRSGTFVTYYKGKNFLNATVTAKCVVDAANVLDETDETNNSAERVFK